MLPPVFAKNPAHFARLPLPFPDVPEDCNGTWQSTKGAPLGLRVIVSDADHEGEPWRHVSVSRADRMPSWNDVRSVKAAFVGDRYAYMVFPDEAHYVNIHPNCLHLYAAQKATMATCSLNSLKAPAVSEGRMPRRVQLSTGRRPTANHRT